MLAECHGDIFQMLDSGKVQAIAHGCNGQGVMGAGVALEVKKRWPDLYDYYQELCKHGNFQVSYGHHTQDDKWVFNLHTQPKPGPCATLDLIRVALTKLDQDAQDLEVASVALPWIGCGLGGLKPSQVKPLFDEILGPSPVQYYLVTYWPHDRPMKVR